MGSIMSETNEANKIDNTGRVTNININCMNKFEAKFNAKYEPMKKDKEQKLD